MNRSNEFEKVENKFKNATYEEMVLISKESTNYFFDYLKTVGCDVMKIISFYCVLSALGIGYEKMVNPKEKQFIKDILSERYYPTAINNAVDNLCQIVDGGIVGSEYNTFKGFKPLGSEFLEHCLNIILGIAYCDGNIDEEVLNKLDEIYFKY